METVSSEDQGVNRGPLQAAVRRSFNDVALQMSLLNRRVGTRLELKDADLECFNLVFTEGPLTPTGLARRSGLHPATVTGVVDRLERAGWVSRERDPDNRRAVLVRALRDRNGELFGLLAGMNDAMTGILDDYSTEELELIVGFLHRTLEAGRRATDDLSADAERS
ncbi:MarR family transcriptional regulator [Jiangella mangrovi]|uniref:DNA-binding MarR family transcriptional regulator n=1 Tax=Jiangella mangrovi TaxID=1524084 RepID=A0A7W9GLX9_9ACTN|nr:MarR family transcriptional regulator [Jiangella mangrovi]MBB5786098.1 DNA-binding MarR family transcriptional regulator [Jiangella mangrovi]